jgi:hypothetical protein
MIDQQNYNKENDMKKLFDEITIKLFLGILFLVQIAFIIYYFATYDYTKNQDRNESKNQYIPATSPVNHTNDRPTNL